MTSDADPLPGLLRGLQSASTEARLAALHALAELGAAAAPAIPDLIATLRASDLTVRTHAADVLARLGAPAVTPLVETLLHPDLDWRRAIIVTLGKIGPAALPAVPVLQAACDDADLGSQAALALAAIQAGPDERQAAPAPHTLNLLLASAGLAAVGVLLVTLPWWYVPPDPANRTLDREVAVAFGLIGGGLGAIGGASLYGRHAAVLAGLLLSVAGYAVGAFIGNWVATLLAPWVRGLSG